MAEKDKDILDNIDGEYKYGFTTDIETETIARGLNEDVIRLISAKKEEPTLLFSLFLCQLQAAGEPPLPFGAAAGEQHLALTVQVQREALAGHQFPVVVDLQIVQKIIDTDFFGKPPGASCGPSGCEFHWS